MPTQQLIVPDVDLGPRVPAMVLQCCAATLVVAVGVFAVAPNARLRQALEAWINIHALFGILLCVMAAGRFYWGVKHAPPARRSDVRDLSRRVSRLLYLLLFLVIGVRQLIGLWNVIWYGGTFEVELPAPAGGLEGAAARSKDDLQALFVAGVLALSLVRLLAYAVWRRAARGLPQRVAR